MAEAYFSFCVKLNPYLVRRGSERGKKVKRKKNQTNEKLACSYTQTHNILLLELLLMAKKSILDHMKEKPQWLISMTMPLRSQRR